VAILVVADIHANLTAFKAVIEDASAAGAIDAIWCLGDIVGYGPEPAACIELLRSFPHVCVAGNHDLAAAGIIGLETFNPFAAEAVRWTVEKLSDAAKAWLGALPQIAVESDFTLVHGSLDDPVWDYLQPGAGVQSHLRRQTTPYGLVGHTHHAFVAYEDAMGGTVTDSGVVQLDGRRLVANPGSAGQPRDGDTRAAYALIDKRTPPRLELCRIAYDIAHTQMQIRAAGLPAFLADRLERGV
jgi:predicted phosphodiesterase